MSSFQNKPFVRGSGWRLGASAVSCQTRLLQEAESRCARASDTRSTEVDNLIATRETAVQRGLIICGGEVWHSDLEACTQQINFRHPTLTQETMLASM